MSHTPRTERRARRPAPRVALATFAELPLLSADDRPLLAALGAEGVEAEPAVWSDAGVDWRAYDAVLLRSCWDYHLRVHDFRAWLDRLEAQHVAVWNPPAVVRWNLDKRYLAELGALGIPVVGTLWLERGTAPDVNALLRLKRWSHIVVKPTVSASGHETWTATSPLTPEELERVRAMLAVEGVMLQPLVEEVVRDGELSLMLFDGRFSHAVRKRAVAGEFRVQNQFGGTAERVTVPASGMRVASRIVRSIPAPLLYARVDGVVSRGRFLLMELEVAEPSLYFGLADGSAERMARLVRGRLARRSNGGRRRG